MISIEVNRFQQSPEFAATDSVIAGGSNLHSGCRCEEAGLGLGAFPGHIGAMRLKHDQFV